jgi:hypothetical protein
MVNQAGEIDRLNRLARQSFGPQVRVANPRLFSDFITQAAAAFEEERASLGQVTGAGPPITPGMEVPQRIDPQTAGLPRLSYQPLPAGPPPTPVARPEPIPQDMGLLATPSPMDLERRRLITQKYLESGLTPPTWASTEELEDFYALRTAPTPPPVEGQVGIPSVEEQQGKPFTYRGGRLLDFLQRAGADNFAAVAAATGMGPSEFLQAVEEERALGPRLGEIDPQTPEARALQRTSSYFPQVPIIPDVPKIRDPSGRWHAPTVEALWTLGLGELGPELLNPFNITPLGATKAAVRGAGAVRAATGAAGGAAGRQAQRAGTAVRGSVERLRAEISPGAVTLPDRPLLPTPRQPSRTGRVVNLDSLAEGEVDTVLTTPGTRVSYETWSGRRITRVVGDDLSLQKEPWRGSQPGLTNIKRMARGENIARGRAALIDRLRLEGNLGTPGIAGETDYGEAFIRALPDELLEDVGLSIRSEPTAGDLAFSRGEASGPRGLLGTYDPALGLATLYRKVIANSRIYADEVLIHELSHSLQRYVPPEDLALLRRQYQREVAAAASRRVSRGATVGVKPELGHRLSSFEEWFAEAITSRGMRDVAERTVPQGGVFTRTARRIREIAVGFYNWLRTIGRGDHAERVYRNLVLGRERQQLSPAISERLGFAAGPEPGAGAKVIFSNPEKAITGPSVGARGVVGEQGVENRIFHGTTVDFDPSDIRVLPESSYDGIWLSNSESVADRMASFGPSTSVRRALGAQGQELGQRRTLEYGLRNDTKVYIHESWDGRTGLDDIIRQSGDSDVIAIRKVSDVGGSSEAVYYFVKNPEVLVPTTQPLTPTTPATGTAGAAARGAADVAPTTPTQPPTGPAAAREAVGGIPERPRVATAFFPEAAAPEQLPPRVRGVQQAARKETVNANRNNLPPRTPPDVGAQQLGDAAEDAIANGHAVAEFLTSLVRTIPRTSRGIREAAVKAARSRGIAIGHRRGKAAEAAGETPTAVAQAVRSGQAGQRVTGGQFEALFEPVPGAPTKGDITELRPREVAEITGLTAQDFHDLGRAIDARFPAVGRQSFANGDAKVGLQRLLTGDVPTLGQSALLRRVFGPEFVRAMRSRRPVSETIGQAVWELVGLLPRQLRSGFEMSAVLRQGAIYVVNPRSSRHKAARRAFAEAYNSLFFGLKGGVEAGERAAGQVVDEILDPNLNPWAKYLYDPTDLDPTGANALFLHDVRPGGALNFTQREETMLTNIIRDIPETTNAARAWLRSRGVAGRVVEPVFATAAIPVRLFARTMRAFEAAYATFLNRLRNDVAVNTLNDWQGAIDDAVRTGRQSELPYHLRPENLEAEFKSLKDVVNTATGRGGATLPQFVQSGIPWLNAIWWAPRFVLSRIETPYLAARGAADVVLNRFGIDQAGAAARKDLAKDFTLWTATTFGILATLEKTGVVDVELDCRSSDFGKGKVVGTNTRFDFWAGLQPMVRYGCQLMSGERKQLSTGEVTKIAGVRYGGLESPPQVRTVLDFMRSKAAPGLVTLTANELAGGTFSQEPLGKMVPLVGENIGPEVPVRVREALEQVVSLFWLDVIESIEAEGAGMSAMYGVPSFHGIGQQTFEAGGGTSLRQRLIGVDALGGPERAPAAGER